MRSRTIMNTIVLGSGLFGAGVAPSMAQCQTAKLGVPDPWKSEEFGTSVDVHQDLLVVGARGEGFGLGAAYVYRLVDGDWLLEAKLAPDKGVRGTDFGAAVSVRSAASGGADVIAVGEPGAGEGNESGLGAVQVYRWDGKAWTLDALPAGLVFQLNAELLYLGDAGHGFDGIACDVEEIECFIAGQSGGRLACFGVIDSCVRQSPLPRVNSP